VAYERDMSSPRSLPTFPPGRPAAPSRAPRPPLTQRMQTGHWIAIDCVVAAVGALLILAAVRPFAPLYAGQAFFPIGALVAAGVFVPMALRRRAPMMAFSGLLVLAALMSGMAMALGAVIFLAVAYTLYTLTLNSSRRNGVAALGLVLALIVIITTTGRDRPQFLFGGAYAPVALANVLAWTTAYSVRQRRLYVVRLQQQAASTAVADERLRIARELHDVVAHSMSVIAVQAGYGQYVIDDSPDGAREALGAIQLTSREALDEMRRMLGVLRAQDAAPVQDQAGEPAAGTGFLTDGVPGSPADRGPRAAAGGRGDHAATQLDGFAAGLGSGGAAPLAPAPGLANLDRLIKRTCGAGVRVNLEVYGQARALPAGLDLSAYRIVQEALTNVVKHAGSGARCTVHLGYDEGVLAIRVTDDGGQSTMLPGYGGAHASGPPGPPDLAAASLAAGDRVPAAVGVNLAAGQGMAGGWRMPREPSVSAGHGIIGMRERAHLCGGEFTARPLRDGGFQVTASLPLTGALPDAEAAV
jgi:signal transduction histidine kinase